MPFEIDQFRDGYEAIETLIKNTIGDEAFVRRMNGIAEFRNSSHRLFRDCQDKLFLYLTLFKALLDNDSSAYNLFEGARIIPVVAKICTCIERITSVSRYEPKVAHLCSETTRDIDGVLFEILIALKYDRLGYTVEFIEENNNVKTPDIKATRGETVKHIECKKMQRGNLYSYLDLDKWYVVSDAIADIINKYSMRCRVHFSFSSELVECNEKRVIRKFCRKLPRMLKSNKKFCVANNRDFKIVYEKIDDAKFNVELDPLRNETGPSYVNYLIGEYVTSHSYKILSLAEKDGVFVSNVKWASILSRDTKCNHTIIKKSQHVKRHLLEALDQLSAHPTRIVHILIEESDGQDVYLARLNRNMETVLTLNAGDDFVGALYLHVAKFLVPLDEMFDVEETVVSFGSHDYAPELITNCWFHEDRAEAGIGTLYEDHA